MDTDGLDGPYRRTEKHCESIACGIGENAHVLVGNFGGRGMVEPHDSGGLFQPWRFCDSINLQTEPLWPWATEKYCSREEKMSRLQYQETKWIVEAIR